MPLPRILKSGIPIPFLPERPEWSAAYERAWELAWETRDIQPASPWQACLAALWQRYAHGDAPFELGTLARLDRLYETRKDVITDTGEWHAGLPPLLAMTEWELYKTTNFEQRLREVFPAVALHFDNHASKARPEGYFYKGPAYGSVGATAMAALESSYIARAGLVCDQHGISENASANYLGFQELVNEKMWDEFRHHYCDVDEDELWTGSFGIDSFWPLVAEITLPDRARETIRHLRNYRSFARKFLIPSLAAYERGFSSAGELGKGAVHPAQTYLVLRGLLLHDEHALASHIAANHLDGLAQVLSETNHFWSYYAPDRISPGNGAVRDERGEAGIATVAMLIEHVMGIRIDAPLNEVEWTVQWPEPHGLQNLRIGEAIVAMEAIPKSGNRFEITLTSSEPVDFKIKAYANKARLISAQKGHQVFEIE